MAAVAAAAAAVVVAALAATTNWIGAATTDQHGDGFSALASWIRGAASHRRHLGVRHGDACLGSRFDPGVIMGG
jgi:hypothetical protein